jgi:hypothetical protein
MFDFGTTSAADQMQIMQEKIAQYIGAKYGEDIANKLQNKTRIVLSAPAYPSTTMTQHAFWIALIRCQQAAMSTGWLSSHKRLLLPQTTVPWSWSLQSLIRITPKRTLRRHRMCPLN